MSAAMGSDRTAGNLRHAREPRATGELIGASENASSLVLIAEDEEPIASALILVVEDAGYASIVATHGREALDLCRAHHPALVITDLMMPYLDGMELIVAIREEAERDGYVPPPIVLMTAAGPRRAQEADADALLRKPFNIADVEDLLHRFLGEDRRYSPSGLAT